jgi:hypothetical protein
VLASFDNLGLDVQKLLVDVFALFPVERAIRPVRVSFDVPDRIKR